MEQQQQQQHQPHHHVSFARLRQHVLARRIPVHPSCSLQLVHCKTHDDQMLHTSSSWLPTAVFWIAKSPKNATKNLMLTTKIIKICATFSRHQLQATGMDNFYSPTTWSHMICLILFFPYTLNSLPPSITQENYDWSINKSPPLHETVKSMQLLVKVA